MGCNCKNKANHIREKYGDNNDIEEDEKIGIFSKILRFFLQITFGIFVGVIVIVMLIPMIIWLIICMMFGIEPHLKLYNISKRLKMGKQNG